MLETETERAIKKKRAVSEFISKLPPCSLEMGS